MKRGLERCTQNDRCPEGMECQSGVCACEMGTMTDDRKFCLKSDEKLLGDYCNPAIPDTCFQLSGRTFYSPFILGHPGRLILIMLEHSHFVTISLF